MSDLHPRGTSRARETGTDRRVSGKTELKGFPAGFWQTEPAITGPGPDLTIVICTYNRPVQLRQALESIARQQRSRAIQLAVVVVDNSDDGSGRAVSMDMGAVLPVPLRYVEAHPPNISIARNAGVRASSSEFVAFIDDDEELAPDWLDQVAKALGELSCDVLFGRVNAVFEIGEPTSPSMKSVYSRRLDAETGTTLLASGPARSRAIALGTGNSIFRRSTTLTDPLPFDPAFGRAGGEDYELFCRLQRRGRRFGWLPDAMVSEFVPAARCEEPYLIRRFFAGGQAYAAAVARNSRRPRLTRWRLRAKAAAQLGTLLPGMLLGPWRSAAARAELRFRLAGVLGKLSLSRLHPLYQDDRKA